MQSLILPGTISVTNVLVCLITEIKEQECSVDQTGRKRGSELLSFRFYLYYVNCLSKLFFGI